MSARAVTRHTYRSGWCGTGQHDRCWGTYAGVDCACRCHEASPLPEPARCPTCGQTLPAVTHAR